MAFFSSQVSVGVGATPLFTFSNNTGSLNDPVPFMVQNPPGGTNVWVGGPNVTTNNGYLLTTGREYTFSIISGEVLYAIAATTQTVYVLQGRH